MVSTKSGGVVVIRGSRKQQKRVTFRVVQSRSPTPSFSLRTPASGGGGQGSVRRRVSVNFDEVGDRNEDNEEANQSMDAGNNTEMTRRKSEESGTERASFTCCHCNGSGSAPSEVNEAAKLDRGSGSNAQRTSASGTGTKSRRVSVNLNEDNGFMREETKRESQRLSIPGTSRQSELTGEGTRRRSGSIRLAEENDVRREASEPANKKRVSKRASHNFNEDNNLRRSGRQKRTSNTGPASKRSEPVTENAGIASVNVNEDPRESNIHGGNSLQSGRNAIKKQRISLNQETQLPSVPLERDGKKIPKRRGAPSRRRKPRKNINFITTKIIKQRPNTTLSNHFKFVLSEFAKISGIKRQQICLKVKILRIEDIEESITKRYIALKNLSVADDITCVMRKEKLMRSVEEKIIETQDMIRQKNLDLDKEREDIGEQESRRSKCCGYCWQLKEL